MNESLIIQEKRPSALNAFFGGASSGFISGASMMGIMFAISIIPAFAILAPSMLVAGGMVLATTLFGGIMNVKRAVFDAPHGHAANVNDVVAMPMAMSGPAIAPVIYADQAPDQAASKSWAAETGRSEGANSKIQQILADGSLSDKDRASVILASREAASTQASRA